MVHFVSVNIVCFDVIKKNTFFLNLYEMYMPKTQEAHLRKGNLRP